MSAFDIPFTQLASMPDVIELKLRKAPAKRGANPKVKPGPKPGTLALKRNEVDPNRTPPPTRNWKDSTYKPPLAMRLALARAHDAQPPLISMSGSTTDGMERDYPK